MAEPRIASGEGQLFLDREGTLHCDGSWTLPNIGKLERVASALPWPTGGEIVCDARGIVAMDTAGAVFLHRGVLAHTRNGRWPVKIEGLQPGFAKLLDLVAQHATQMDTSDRTIRQGAVERFGRSAWSRVTGAIRAMEFIGQGTTVLLGAVMAPWGIRWRSFLKSLEDDGFKALPIIGLLSFLMGIVIAYQGAEQLRTVGGNIFIVDLVGISLLREIAPLVTAILVAGRSGSAYTAQIGTMRVTEELDALQTLGLSPFKVLVLPKVLALGAAVPLLAVYADLCGVVGGMLIAAGQLNVSFHQFVTRFDEAVALRHFVIGIVKAPVFAAIIALVGCYQGFQIRGGVDDVGRRTTVSVVQSIFLVIVFDAFFSIVMSWWNL